MITLKVRLLAWSLILFTGFTEIAAAAPAQRLRFEVSVDSKLAPQPAMGRLLIFMTTNAAKVDVISTDWMRVRSVWCCAREVEAWTPDKVIEVDPDVMAFPELFSNAPTGSYQIMALLDADHSYANSGMGPGDLRSEVTRIEQLEPNNTKPVELKLTKRIPARAPNRDTDSVKLVTLRSELLSAFWGRPIEIRAGVRLPPSYRRDPARRYPTVYVVHGFGGSLASAWSNSENGRSPSNKEMAAGKWPEMIYVYLDANCPLGHQVFADSVNNGPWGAALTTEFIPHLEKAFRMDAIPEGRLLTGHSSGGWSTLWLQVNYPDIFGGTWSTSPDPVDFRNWTGPNLTKIPAENFYFKPDGNRRWLLRFGGKDSVTVEDYARWEKVLGDYGGQLASFDAVFSPRGDDGQPMPMFNRDTGAIDASVQKAWERYDISRRLKENWARLGPKLQGKIHVAVGTLDNIHLEESVYLLRDRMKELGSDAQFTVLEGKDHFTLYENKLAQRMAWEMYKVARPKEEQPKPEQ